MDSIAAILADLEKSVQCAICLESLRNPVTTRCGHNFCDFCLSKALQGKTHMPCPLCNKAIKQRSLKKALRLSTVVPLVHKMVDQVQEHTGFSCTSAQTTEQASAPSASVPMVTNVSKSNQDLVLHNGDMRIILPGNSNMREKANSWTSASGAVKETEDIEQSQIVHQADQSINRNAESDSVNIVSRLTVIADVHRSPVINLDRISMGDKSSVSTVTLQSELSKENGSVLKPIVTNMLGISEISEKDPYVFPISQKALAPVTAVKNLTLKKRKSASDSERCRPKRHKNTLKAVSDAEMEKVSANKMITEMNHHSLVAEKIPIPTRGFIQQDKLKPLDSDVGTSIKFKQEKPLKKKVVAVVGAEHTESPRLRRRLLSESTSSSSEVGCSEKCVLPRDDTEQPNYKDKVSNWLESAAPSTVSDMSTCSTPPYYIDDDLISHSQVSVEHLHNNRIIIVKRRKITSPVKLDPKIQESVKNQLWSRDAAVFGNKKPRKTFLLKKRNRAKCALKSKAFSKKCLVVGGRERKTKLSSKSEEASGTYNCIPGRYQGISLFEAGAEKPETNLLTEKSTAFESSQNGTAEMLPTTSDLKLVIKEIGSCQSENYDIQDVDVLPDSTNSRDLVDNYFPSSHEEDMENDFGNQDAEVLTQQQHGQTSQKSNSPKSPSNIMVLNKVEMASRSMIRQVVQPKKEKVNVLAPLNKTIRKGTSGMRSGKYGFPMLGESPTIGSSSETPKGVDMPSTSGVDLGLLDFSESLQSSKPNMEGSIGAKGPRPEAVAETCRMVFQTLGQFTTKEGQTIDDNSIQDSKRTSQKRFARRKAMKNLKNTPLNEKDAATDSRNYLSDSSVLPPSTSSAGLDMPSTPLQCDPEKIPPELHDTENEEAPQEASDIRGVNYNIIRNAPLPDEKNIVEPDNGKDMESVGCSVFESSGVSDDGNGTLQCLTNGWGGTKLRIFRTTSSDRTDAELNLREFSAKKKAGGADLCPKANCDQAVQPAAAAEKENHPEGKEAVPELIAEVVPNSENPIGFVSKDNSVRKSTRKNKGLKQTFDYVRLIPGQKQNNADVGNGAKTKHKEPKPASISQPDKNIVLQHIEEAIAETQLKQGQGSWQHHTTLKDRLSQNKSSSSKKGSGGMEKLTKTCDTKKETRRLQTGKRTKENLAVLSGIEPWLDNGNSNETASGVENINLWLSKKERQQVSFFCSQPSTLPKHITNVFVKLTNLNWNSSNDQAMSNLSVNRGGYEQSEDLIDASPMLFKSQENTLASCSLVNGPSRQERSISIDLSKPLNKNHAIIELDSVQNDVEFDKDEADDVICCSWNEVENVDTCADESCHEDVSIISTANPLEGDAAKSSEDNRNEDQMVKRKDHLLDSNTVSVVGNVEEVVIEDNDIKGIVEALKKLSTFEKSTVAMKLPQSAEILHWIIGKSKEAVELVQVEISARKEHNCETMEEEFSQSTLGNENEDYKLSLEVIGSSQTPRKRKLGRPPKANRKASNKAACRQKQDKKRVNSKRSSACGLPSTSEIDTVSGTKPSSPGIESKPTLQKSESVEQSPAESVEGESMFAPSKKELHNASDARQSFDTFRELPSRKSKSVEQSPAEGVERGSTLAKSQKEGGTPSGARQSLDTFRGCEESASSQMYPDNERTRNRGASRSFVEVIASLNRELEDSNRDIWEQNIKANYSDMLKKTGSKSRNKENVIATTKNRGPGTSKVHAVHAKSPLDRSSDIKTKGEVNYKPKPGDERSTVGTPDTLPKKVPDESMADDGVEILSKNDGKRLEGWLESSEQDRDKTPVYLHHRSHSTPSLRGSPDWLCGVSVVVTKTTTKEIEAARNMKTYNGTPTQKDESPGPSISAAQNERAGDVQRWLENSQPEAMPPPEIHSAVQRWGCVTTGLQEKDVRLVRMLTSRCNGQLYHAFDINRVTHVIVRATHQRSCDRTLKYLQGIAGKKWIVGLEWVTDSITACRKLPEVDYEILGDNSMREFELEGCVIPQAPMRSRMSDPTYKHLQGFRCVCLPPYSLITTEQTSALLRMCGATVVGHLGELVSMDNFNGVSQEERLIIVDADVAGVPNFSAMGEEFSAIIVSIEWVYESISRFEAQPLDDYMVTGFTQDSSDHF